MRRIIERVVTIVTTTTWKISWETDPAHAQPKTDPVSEELSHLEILPESMPSDPTVIETKEVHLHERQNLLNPPAEGLPDDLNFYLLKKGNEKS